MIRFKDIPKEEKPRERLVKYGEKYLSNEELLCILLKTGTKKYNVNKLVYFEQTSDINEAIKREKILKKWNREWKIELIKKQNPKFKDLSSEWEF